MEKLRLTSLRMQPAVRAMLDELTAQSGLGLGATIELAIREKYRREMLLKDVEMKWAKESLLAEPKS